jgi:hypothetical protein
MTPFHLPRLAKAIRIYETTQPPWVRSGPNKRTEEPYIRRIQNLDMLHTAGRFDREREARGPS